MDPHDVGYCCQYMPEGQCGTLSLESYFFNSNGYASKTILFPLFSSTWYTILLLFFLYVMRVVSYKPNESITDQDFLEKEEYKWTFRRFTIPAIIYGAIFWMLGMSVAINITSILYFYVLYGLKPEADRIACYLAWLKEGTPLYGVGIGLLLYTFIAFYLFMIAMYLRPKYTYKVAQTLVDKLMSLPPCQNRLRDSRNNNNDNKDVESVSIAYPNAFDGLRSMAMIEEFLDRPRSAGATGDDFDGGVEVNFQCPVHVSMIDAYNNRNNNSQYTAGHDSVMIRKNAQLSRHEDLMSHITIESMTPANDEDQRQEDFYKLYTMQDSRFDLIVLNMYIYQSKVMGFQLMMVDEMINGQNENRVLKKTSRMINFYREMRRILKPLGYLFFTVDAAYGLKAAEEQRRLLKLAGFRTKLVADKQSISYFDPLGLGWRNMPRNSGPGALHIIAMKEEKYNDGGVMTVDELKDELKSRVSSIARSQSVSASDIHGTATANTHRGVDLARDPEASAVVLDDDMIITEEWMNLVGSVSQEDKPWYELPLSKEKITIIWSGWVFLCVILYFVAFNVLTYEFEHMEFPKRNNDNLSNYFVWNVLAFVVGSPFNLFLGLALLYYQIQDPSFQGTFKTTMKVCMTFSFVSYFFSVILNFPAWVVTIAISYYLVYIVFGVPPNNFTNGILTALIITALVRVIIYIIYRNRPEVMVEKDGIPELGAVRDTVVVTREKDYTTGTSASSSHSGGGGAVSQGVSPQGGNTGGIWDLVHSPLRAGTGGTEESNKIEMGSVDSSIDSTRV